MDDQTQCEFQELDETIDKARRLLARFVLLGPGGGLWRYRETVCKDAQAFLLEGEDPQRLALEAMAGNSWMEEH